MKTRKLLKKLQAFFSLKEHRQRKRRERLRRLLKKLRARERKLDRKLEREKRRRHRKLLLNELEVLREQEARARALLEAIDSPPPDG
ncbi:MAG: hypothetical protein D6786_02120 [Gammaproteobacteria bacterium]|nr:MAG: hypothetical protein D6786_02120 [Gammaproteobacteria bacterium]